MKIHHILPVLSVAGMSFAIYIVFTGSQPLPVAAAVVEPASAPYQTFIAGSGIIEAQSQNVAIGTPLSGIVANVLVNVGNQVKQGTPLFYLDDRDTQAELKARRADLAKAKAETKVAEAVLADAKTSVALAEAVSDRRAISEEELLKRRNALTQAQARLDSALASVGQAEAALHSTEVMLERLVVKAPMDAEVLQVNIRAGEFAQAGVLSTPLLLLGDLQSLHVRVDIDENDVWRFDKNGKAVAFLRGNRDFNTQLTLAYVEPFVVPKKSLTGDSTERVDTRVLQVLYRFDKQSLPVYVGQQMDVFIETQESKTALESGKPTS